MPQIIDVCPLVELEPGEVRLVEWEDLEIGVFNCAGDVYAIEDRCSHDDGPLAEGEVDPDGCTVECPAPRLAVRPAHRQAADLARLRSGGHLSGDHRGRHDQAGGGVAMALTENEQLAQINADYTERYGFHDAENYLYKAPKGLNREIVEKISEFKSEPQWMRDFRLKALRSLPGPAAADLGLADAGRGRLRRHPLLRARLRAGRALLGRRARGRQEHLRPARHPRGRAQVPLRRRRPVRVRGRLPPGARGPREAGRDLHRHGLGAARARGARPRVLRDDHPAERQQARRAQQLGVVGRLVRLRPAGRARRDAAAGLLPDQHRVDGPVRADADHRRRGLLRALRRGLHRADLLELQPALRGRRADRQAGRADPLHDGAELVARTCSTW